MQVLRCWLRTIASWHYGSIGWLCWLKQSCTSIDNAYFIPQSKLLRIGIWRFWFNQYSIVYLLQKPENHQSNWEMLRRTFLTLDHTHFLTWITKTKSTLTINHIFTVLDTHPLYCQINKYKVYKDYLKIHKKTLISTEPDIQWITTHSRYQTIHIFFLSFF